MSELLNKLSSYNIFNYLLPGVIFAALSDRFTHTSFLQSDIIVGVFVYYFVGMIISRVGSLVIEPIAKWTRFVKYADYRAYVASSAKDTLLPVLSEANNTYRTFCALFLCFGILKLYEYFETVYPSIIGYGAVALISGLALLFVFSYQKQSAYITKRITANQ